MFLDYDVGGLIHKLRCEQKISQERLSEGICTASTISRIENGSQIPKRELLQELLERLGEPGFFHSHYLDTKFYYQSHLKRVILENLGNGMMQSAGKYIHEYERDCQDNNMHSAQFIGFSKLIYRYLLGDKSTKYIQDCIELLRISHRNFDIDCDFSEMLFNHNEFLLLNYLSVCLSENNNMDEAIHILTGLAKKIFDCKHFLPSYWKVRAVILNNLALYKYTVHNPAQAIIIIDDAHNCAFNEGGYLFFLKVLRSRCFLYAGINDKKMNIASSKMSESLKNGYILLPEELKRGKSFSEFKDETMNLVIF